MPSIMNPHLTVVETVAEPEIGNASTTGSVPCLAITVGYQAMFSGMEQLLPPGYGFRESITIKGTFVRLSFNFLPVVPDGPQVIPREVSALVEKALVTRGANVLQATRVQCAISVAAEPDTQANADTNAVDLPGLPVDTPVNEAPTIVQRVLTWIERLVTRREP